MSQIKSPNYPSKGLADAIDAVAKIEGQYRSSTVSREDAAVLIGYSSLSGPATKALGALASYNLTERAGTGMIRLTPLARSILHPASEQERVTAMTKAGLAPSLFREIKEHFGDIPVPPEQGVVSYLNRAGFHPSAVPKAAKAFLNTVELLEGLAKPADQKADASDGAEMGKVESKFGGASIGDYVQWESQGALQFKEPLRVRWVSADGAHLAVDGSDAGIPMDEVVVEPAATKPQVAGSPPPQPPQPQAVTPQSPPPLSPPPREQPSAGFRTAVFPVSDGDVTFIFPESLTLDGIEELEDYLAVFLKKEKRLVQKPRGGLPSAV